jgi:UDP-sugar transporter A1/2/3
LNTTAIFFAEVMKFVASSAIHWFSCKDSAQFVHDVWQHSGARPVELAKTCIPSLLYVVQNNLIFIAISHLSAGSYQVAYQFKIITTAGLSVIILGTRLNGEKWFALLMLTIGIALVSSSGAEAKAIQDGSSAWVGFGAIVGACFTSGLAGVYLEKILKQTTASIWVRNMQLAFFGASFALAFAFRTDGDLISKGGMTQGYSKLIWSVVALQALGGLVVAAVMKYADNILKCFGCAIGIVITCFLSVVELKEFTPNLEFSIGLCMVVLATGVYSLGLPSKNAFARRGEEQPLLPNAVQIKQG